MVEVPVVGVRVGAGSMLCTPKVYVCDDDDEVRPTLTLPFAEWLAMVVTEVSVACTVVVVWIVQVVELVAVNEMLSQGCASVPLVLAQVDAGGRSGRGAPSAETAEAEAGAGTLGTRAAVVAAVVSVVAVQSLRTSRSATTTRARCLKTGAGRTMACAALVSAPVVLAATVDVLRVVRVVCGW